MKPRAGVGTEGGRRMKARILIVDDSYKNRYLMRAMFMAEGFDVAEAQNGIEALEKGRALLPDLMVTDLLMPRMDGFALCREWTRDEALRDIPIVVFSATYTDATDRQLVIDLGAADFIPKPAGSDEVLGTVRKILARGPGFTGRAPRIPDGDFHERYSERLSRKLDHKIAELVQTRQALEDYVARSEACLDAHPDPIVSLDSGLRIRAWNFAAERLFGHPESGAIGASFDLVADAELLDDVFDRLAQARETRRVVRWEMPLRRQDGTVVEAAISITFLGQDIGYLLVLSDLTAVRLASRDRERLEAQIAQTERLASLGRLAAAVAHEINNPLNVLLNYGQLISDAPSDVERVKDFIGNLMKEGERIATIVRDLLSFSRQRAEAHSPARLADIVNGTLSLTYTLLRRDQISLEVDVPEDLPTVLCRTQQIQQVVMNLVHNARDALNERYPGPDPDKTIRIAATRMDRDVGSWVRLTVEDHGCGIPEEVEERIFDPFVTTKSREKGTGLGLSISYGIVQDHKGEIGFERVPGGGTCFHVDLRAEC